MADRRGADAEIEPRESPGAPLFRSRGRLFVRTEEIVGQKGDEGHGNDPGGHERTCEDHGEAVDEGSRIPLEEEEGQVGHDIGDRRIHNDRGELGGPQPGGDRRGMTGVEVPLDGVPRHHRVIDEESQGDDQGGDGYLLHVDAQQMHHPEGHGHGEGDGQG